MNEFVSSKPVGQVCVIEIDSPPVNALSQAVRQGYHGAVATRD